MEKLRIRGVSLYFQVENYIKEKIMSDEWPKGYKLPSEPELASQLNVSRSTIRQAIAELADSGLLIRRQGVGTYVANTIYEGDFITRYLPDDFGKMHRLVSTRVVAATFSLAEKLQIPRETPLYEIKRIRYLREEEIPAILEISYLEERKFPNLPENELSGNVKMYDLLKNVYQTQLSFAKSSIEPTVLKEEEACLLNSDKGRPVLMLTRICSNQAKVPIILTKSLIRPDRCRITFEDSFL